MDYPEIMRHTADAWEEVSLSVFRASWVICGYFTPEHFDDSKGISEIPMLSLADVKHIVEPCGVMEGGPTFTPTPQYCCTYDWRIQDRFANLFFLTWGPNHAGIFTAISTVLL